MKKYVQCPRCELNYITTPSDKYCKVCMREMKGEGGQDDVEMCSVCNENPALPGRDICLFCLKEMNAQAAESVGAASDDSGDGDGEQVTPRSLTDMDDVGSMDEIQMLPEETDGEYTKMAGEMTSLEGMQEDEANEDGEEKPMDIFGDHWENHFAHIAADWRARVKDGDVVLIPGDISWAMQLERAVPDLQKIGALPGRKVLIKGNHDYWWNSVSKLRRVLPEGMSALQHDALDMGDFVVCGTRGWMFPTGDAPLAPEDERILNRELLRLDMAISAAEKLAQGQKPIVVMLHYPPLLLTVLDTPFTQVLARHRVHTVVYGHLHGAGIRAGFNGEHEGIHYRLTSCDALGFRLTEVPLMTTISNS